MAAEQRLAFSAYDGTLTAAALSGDETLTSAEFGSLLPAISDPFYLAVTLGPDTATPETVWIIAHVDGSDDVTVQRGAEGSTAQAWPDGTAWVHAPTPYDKRFGDYLELRSSQNPALAVYALATGDNSNAFIVSVDNGLGARVVHAIENNVQTPTSPHVDINYRHCVVNIGDPDDTISVGGTKLRILQPPGSTANLIEVLVAGSQTSKAFRVTNAGAVLINSRGLATRAFAINTAEGDTSGWAPWFAIDEDGEIAWGPGGDGSALDVTLGRAATGVLEVGGKIRQTGTPTQNTDLATKAYVDSVSGGGFGFGQSVTSQTSPTDATGATSSLDAFEEARDAAGVDGVVHVPSGDWLVPDLDLNVAGQRWILQPGARLITSSLTKVVVTISADGVRLYAPDGGGKVDGQRTTTYADTGKSCVMVTGDDVVVEGLTIIDSAMHGVYVQNAAGAKIRDNYIGNTWGNGVFAEILAASAASVDVEALEIAHNQIERRGVPAATARGGGIKVHGDKDATNGTHELAWAHITDNWVALPDTPAQTGTNCIEVFGLSPYSTITENRTYWGRMGVSVDRSDYCTVGSNVIYSPYRSGGTYGVGIELAGSKHCAVDANIIDGGGRTRHGIACWSANEGDAEAADNTIGTNTIGNLSTSSIAYGIVVQSPGTAQQAFRITLAGNNIEVTSSTSMAIRASNVVGLSISGGNVYGATTAERAIYLNSCAQVGIGGGIVLDGFAGSAVHLVGDSGDPFTLDDILVSGAVVQNCTKTLTQASGASVTPTLGSRIRWRNNTGNTAATNSATAAQRCPAATQDIDDYAAYVGAFVGAGAPAIFAGIGSTYRRTDAPNASSAFYVKTSAVSSSSGWTALS